MLKRNLVAGENFRLEWAHAKARVTRQLIDLRRAKSEHQRADFLRRSRRDMLRTTREIGDLS